MKVSMSIESENVEVTLSVTTLSQASLREGPHLRLQSSGSSTSDEVQELLEETLRLSVSDSLRAANGNIRVALAEMLLSQMRGSRIDTSFSRIQKDFEGVAYGSAAPPTEIVVVIGPEGCGKTTNANKLAKHFNATYVIDGDSSDRPVPRNGRTLILTTLPASEALSAIAHGRAQMDFEEWVDSIRFISFTAAMQELN